MGCASCICYRACYCVHKAASLSVRMGILPCRPAVVNITCSFVCLHVHTITWVSCIARVLLQVTSYGLSRFAEGSHGLELLDILAADQGMSTSCLTFESMLVIAANCPNLKVRCTS